MDHSEKPENWLADSRANFTDTMAFTFCCKDKTAKAVRLSEQAVIVGTYSQRDLIFVARACPGK